MEHISNLLSQFANEATKAGINVPHESDDGRQWEEFLVRRTLETARAAEQGAPAEPTLRYAADRIRRVSCSVQGCGCHVPSLPARCSLLNADCYPSFDTCEVYVPVS